MTKDELKTNLHYYGAYFEAMFWADVDGSDDIQGDYDIMDIDNDMLEKMCKELDAFFEKAGPILGESDYTHDQACHDFYFTRCGHGVGFWENDHCNESQGQALTDIAKEFNEVCISEDNGKLYID